MKKIGLLSIIGCSVSGVAIAAGVDCSVIPTCAELGFIKTTTECEGKKTLRCPFDITNDSAVYCGDAPVCSDEFNLDACPANGDCEECGSKYHFVGCEEGYTEENGSCILTPVVKTCVVGDVLYNDLNCYTTAPSGKTAIGVVFDTTNKLAIELTSRNGYEWGYGTDITTMTNCSSFNVTTTCDIDGKTNTSRIVAALGSRTNYAAGFCYNLTTGGLPTGSWFLPSLKELNTIYTNKSTLDTAITSAGGTTISNSYCWSSTVAISSHAWGLDMSNGSAEGLIKLASAYYVRCAVSYASGGNGDDNEESCSTDYSLDTCPTNGVCSECGGKKKLDSCTEGYELQDGACVAATPATGQGCTSVGSILYNDLNCYTTAPSGKTAIGVVFDTTNKLAVGLTHSSRRMYWWSSNTDVSGLENCTDESTVKTTCGTNGKTNSAALVAAGYTNASYAAGYCYNQTTGGLAKGDWFLPSLKELNTIYTNKSTIESAITSAGGATITSHYWSSTEYSSGDAWILYMFGGNEGNSSKTDDLHVRCAVAY